MWVMATEPAMSIGKSAGVLWWPCACISWPSRGSRKITVAWWEGDMSTRLAQRVAALLFAGLLVGAGDEPLRPLLAGGPAGFGLNVMIAIGSLIELLGGRRETIYGLAGLED